MNERGLQSSFWTMVIIQTLGSVDMPGRGERKMPAPRQYVAILVTWIILQIVSSFSAAAERATAAIGWTLVLTGLVVGPFGKQVVNLFTTITTQFSPNSSLGKASAQAEAATGTPPGSSSSITPFAPTGVTLNP